MIDKEKIARINQLAAKARTEQGLSEDELRERDLLRREYIDSVKHNVKKKLENVKFVEDLSEEELKDLKKGNS